MIHKCGTPSIAIWRQRLRVPRPSPFVNGEAPRQPDKNNNTTRDTPALRMSPPRSPTTRGTLYDGFGGFGGALGGPGVASDDTAFVKGATARLLAPPWWSYGRQ